MILHNRRWEIFVLTVAAVMLCCRSLSADTVIMKDGTRLKGLILDEFKDRIALSTVDGEKTIMKPDIRSAVYDSEEKALMQKGANQIKKGQQVKSYYTFKKVLELNPNNRKAKERLHYLKVYLETKLSQDLDERIASKNQELKGTAGKSPAERVADEFGMVLAEGEKYVYIEKMAGGDLSLAEKVLEPGDKIVSVWGEMMAFMRVDEVAQAFSAPEEVRVTIERVLVSKVRSANGLFGRLSFNKYSNMIGADLALLEEGVVVEKVVPGGAFDEAGVREGDILSRIDGKNTLYMPMSGIIRVIENKQERDMEIVVRRDITLWRKE